MQVPVALAVQSYQMSWVDAPQEPPCWLLVVAPCVSNATGPAPLIGVAAEQSSFGGALTTTFVVKEPVPVLELKPPICSM